MSGSGHTLRALAAIKVVPTDLRAGAGVRGREEGRKGASAKDTKAQKVYVTSV